MARLGFGWRETGRFPYTIEAEPIHYSVEGR
jgi:hypothetical protein